jgi:prepilin peptidase CpaA
MGRLDWICAVDRFKAMGLIILQAVLWTTVLVALCLGAASDLRDRIIPNELVALVAACGLLLCLIARLETVWISLLAAILIFLALGVIAHFDLIGGGDVKLISATTLLVPPERIGMLFFAIAIAGGVLSCLYLAARQMVNRSVTLQSAGANSGASTGGHNNLFKQERARIATGEPMPYGLAIFAGVVITIISEPPQCYSEISSLF